MVAPVNRLICRMTVMVLSRAMTLGTADTFTMGRSISVSVADPTQHQNTERVADGGTDTAGQAEGAVDGTFSTLKRVLENAGL